MTSQGVLITGGARRVGAAIARHFARQGYDIALHYHRSKSDAAKLKKEIETLGRACALFAHDLADIEGIPALMKSVKKAMPHCAVLINNASIFERVEFLETDEVLFDRQMTINFKAPFFLTQAFAREFVKGSVVNILDTDIAQTHGTHFVYLLSKKALTEFTLMASRTLGPKVRVNAVCPGYVLANSASDAAYIRKIEKALPLKAHARLEEVAETVLWASRQHHMTGQIIYIDGGKHVL